MEELERGVALGARGVKMHPGLGRYFPADERMMPLYARLEELGLPILSDTGALRGGPGDDVYGMPDHFIPVFERFPRLQFIMAHMPGAYWDQRIDIAKRFPQVLFDTAGGFDDGHFTCRDGRRACALEDADRLIRTLGVERVLFGSDAPGADQTAAGPATPAQRPQRPRVGRGARRERPPGPGPELSPRLAA